MEEEAFPLNKRPCRIGDGEVAGLRGLHTRRSPAGVEPSLCDDIVAAHTTDLPGGAQVVPAGNPRPGAIPRLAWRRFGGLSR